jgi:hypothetical protein
VKSGIFITAAAVLLAAPLAANAYQTQGSNPSMPGMDMGQGSMQGPAPASPGAGANFTGSADAQMTPAQAPATDAAGANPAAPDAAAATSAPAHADMSGTTGVVSSNPVPDTPDNRAKYPPMSRTGLHTKPAGN